MNTNSQIYETFIINNPEYKKIQDKIVEILSEYEEKQRLQELLPNECFIFGIMGIIDRLFYDEGVINEGIYDEVQELIKKLAKFNFFTYYHSKLFNLSSDISDSQILENKLYI